MRTLQRELRIKLSHLQPCGGVMRDLGRRYAGATEVLLERLKVPRTPLRALPHQWASRRRLERAPRWRSPAPPPRSPAALPRRAEGHLPLQGRLGRQRLDGQGIRRHGGRPPRVHWSHRARGGEGDVRCVQGGAPSHTPRNGPLRPPLHSATAIPKHRLCATPTSDCTWAFNLVWPRCRSGVGNS